jgi:hypothetical protein
MTPASDRRRTVRVPLTPVKTGISWSLTDSNSGSQPRPQAHIGTQPRLNPITPTGSPPRLWERKVGGWTRP